MTTNTEAVKGVKGEREREEQLKESRNKQVGIDYTALFCQRAKLSFGSRGSRLMVNRGLIYILL